MKEFIKIIVKHPDSSGHIEYVKNTLEDLQGVVGGQIETVTVATNLSILCNEEGRLLDLPDNVVLCGLPFVGTIALVGTDGEDFTDVPITISEYRRYFLGEER